MGSCQPLLDFTEAPAPIHWTLHMALLVAVWADSTGEPQLDGAALCNALTDPA